MIILTKEGNWIFFLPPANSDSREGRKVGEKTEQLGFVKQQGKKVKLFEQGPSHHEQFRKTQFYNKLC